MPPEVQAIAYALGLVLAILAAAILTHPKTRAFLMRLLIVAAAAASALAIAGCVSPGGLELKPPATSAAATPQERLELLKEANRHIETCDRTYAWPFSVMITCKAKQDATDLAAQIGAAVKAALAEARAAAPPAGP